MPHDPHDPHATPETPGTNKSRAADHLVATLLAAGVDRVFGLSGNQIMAVYDAAIDTPLELVHARHEAGAVFMADGYARVTGDIGVALVTAGPGFANALGPLFSLRHSATPLLLLSGDSATTSDGKGAFQELDQIAVSKGLAKQAWRITDAASLPGDIARAISIAKSGRPGAVHLALPENILSEEIAGEENLSFAPEAMALSAGDCKTVMDFLAGAKSPVIITGPSLAKATPELVKTLPIPVVLMQSPRGMNDPAIGDFKAAVKSADRILMLDKDVDFSNGFGSADILPAEDFATIAATEASLSRARNLLGSRLKHAILAAPRQALDALMEAGLGKITPADTAWRGRVLEAVAQRTPRTPPREGRPIAPDILALMADAVAAHNPIIILDGGEFGQWTQAMLPPMGGEFYLGGMAGAIGGSLPQAIGAAFANPGRRVISLFGDGTAGFHFAEVEVARKYDLPITFVIGNDCRWGAEVEIQKRRYGDARSIGCMLDEETRYDRLAHALGAKGSRAGSCAEFTRALDESLAHTGPYVIDALIEGFPAPVI